MFRFLCVDFVNFMIIWNAFPLSVGSLLSIYSRFRKFKSDLIKMRRDKRVYDRCRQCIWIIWLTCCLVKHYGNANLLPGLSDIYAWDTSDGPSKMYGCVHVDIYLGVMYPTFDGSTGMDILSNVSDIYTIFWSNLNMSVCLM